MGKDGKRGAQFIERDMGNAGTNPTEGPLTSRHRGLSGPALCHVLDCVTSSSSSSSSSWWCWMRWAGTKKAAAYPRAPAGLSCVSDATALAAGVTQGGRGAGMGSGGTEEVQTVDVPRAGSPQPWLHLPGLVWGSLTWPACSEGGALLCGSMHQILAAFGAQRCLGVVSGSPVRCCVGQLKC